jgi:hypothetical protein
MLKINRLFKGGPLDDEVINIPHTARTWVVPYISVVGKTVYFNLYYSMGAGEIFHYTGKKKPLTKEA